MSYTFDDQTFDDSKNELKSNKRINKTAIKSNAKIFPIYN